MRPAAARTSGSVMPARSGSQGPGEITIASGAQGDRVLHRQRVVAVDDRLGPQLAQIVDEIVGEAVVVIDQEQHRLARPGRAWRRPRGREPHRGPRRQAPCRAGEQRPDGAAQAQFTVRRARLCFASAARRANMLESEPFRAEDRHWSAWTARVGRGSRDLPRIARRLGRRARRALDWRNVAAALLIAISLSVVDGRPCPARPRAPRSFAPIPSCARWACRRTSPRASSRPWRRCPACPPAHASCCRSSATRASGCWRHCRRRCPFRADAGARHRPAGGGGHRRAQLAMPPASDRCVVRRRGAASSGRAGSAAGTSSPRPKPSRRARRRSWR